jgi:hypothetical protein
VRALLLLVVVGCGRVAFDPMGDAGTDSGGATADPGNALGAIAWWKLDETSGNTAMDSIGSAHGVFGGPGTPTWVAGHDGGAVDFTGGGGDHIHIGAAPVLANLPALTVTAWIRPATVANDGAIRCVFDKGTPTAGWAITIGEGGEGRVGFHAFYATSQESVQSVDNAVAANAWSFVAASWDGGTGTTGIRLYVDAARLTTSVVTGAIGTRPDDSGIDAAINCINATSYTGAMDDVRIYDRVLSAAEIAQLYGS